MKDERGRDTERGRERRESKRQRGRAAEGKSRKVEWERDERATEMDTQGKPRDFYTLALRYWWKLLATNESVNVHCAQ